MKTSILIDPGLAIPVKEFWFAKVKGKSLTSARFEPKNLGLDQKRW